MDLIKSNIIKVKNAFFNSNTYLLKNTLQNNCIIIDPGLDTLAIAFEIEKNKLLPIAILATHGHFDHIGSVKFFQEKYNIPYYLHEKDVKLAQSANFYLKIAKLPIKVEIIAPDITLKQPIEEFNIGEFKITAHHLPGHSYGSCVFQIGMYLFSGDIIYKTGLGFNNFPGENKEMLKTSIRYIFDNFDENSTIYPGHGVDATLFEIKNYNKALIDFIS